VARYHYDLLIRNARIVDGSGNPWFRASLGVRGARIAEVGHLPDAEADVVLDADDRYLAPGFVDAHVHAEVALLNEPSLEAATRQGVTSHVIGQDGISYAPANDATASEMCAYFAAVNGEPVDPLGASSVAEFLERFDRKVAPNVAYLIPHGNVRSDAMGLAARAPTAPELSRMQQLVEEGMRDGAVGVSTGLDYVPCRHADTEELIALARSAAAHGGVFVAHMRGYGPRVRVGMDEMYRIAREARAPVHVSHFNVPAEEGLGIVDAGRREGLDVTYDLYPYLAGSSTLMLWLPNDLHVGSVESMLVALRSPSGRDRAAAWFEGEAEDRLVGVRFSHLVLPEHQDYIGMTPHEAARAAGARLGTFLVDLLIHEELKPGVVASFASSRSEDDLHALMRHPAMMAGSDGIYVGANPHPRGWGAFARYLATYVRDLAVVPLEDAVRRMTSFPARRFGLRDRGRLEPGAFADLALFDLDAVQDRATYDHARALADGFDHVVVNGRPVLWEGALTGETPGRPAGRGEST
jgi:N-acyl-D-amino-acid deacylase